MRRSRPSLLVVVQRYGDVAGGAEAHARMLVQRLRKHVDVEVATTTARDYWTWDGDQFLPGEDAVDDVVVHRFPVRGGRARDFRVREWHAQDPNRSLADERAFLRAQGPVVPDLLEFLFQRGRDFDHVLFFTYIYYPTVYGLPLVPERAVLVPTAHDEWALRLTAYRALFHAARAIAFNSAEERELVHRLFANRRIPHEVVGVGVDAAADASAERFRAKHGLEGPLLFYLGRIVESKGCDQLFEFFARWKDEDRARRATLVVAGRAEMAIPRRDDVRHLGYLADDEKFDAYAACDAFVLPSPMESLSIVTLEAWAMGKPVVCREVCDVVREMSRRANAGLWYRTYPEFAEVLDLVFSNRALGERLGDNGRAFVGRTYTWPIVVEKYLDLFAEVRSRNA